MVRIYEDCTHKWHLWLQVCVHLEVKLKTNVEGGLPPIAQCQSPLSWLIHRYRGQAPSHLFNCVSP